MVFCNIKGGSGKTTLAVNVAATLKGKVLLLDADPQRSAQKWLDAAEKPLPVVCMAYSERNIHREILKVEEQFDFILVDTPPSGLAASPVARQALTVADLAVIPVTPSPVDIRETVDMADQIEEIAGMRGEEDPLRARLVVNRLRAGTTFGKAVQKALDEIGIPLCKTAIHEREAHKHAALEGVSIHQIATRGGRTARMDIGELTQELEALLKGA
jgi:chromosome partitioning protein